jgi:hypothetical protein
MNHSRKVIAATVAVFVLTAVAATLPLLELGHMNLVDYDDWYHDSAASTLAVSNLMAGTVINQCVLQVFDKKGVPKSAALFTNAVGMDKVTIEYFEKTWAILFVEPANLYYSINVGKTVAVLGTADDTAMNFEFAGKAGVVSYFGGLQQAQLFDKYLVQITNVTVIDTPTPLNNGTFFYCDTGGGGDGRRSEVWKVKKGLFCVVSDWGRFDLINEAKRLCCIRSNTIHKIYNYK